MPATKIQRTAKRPPMRDALSVIIDVFSLLLCMFMLILTASLLSVWQPVGLWAVLVGLIGLIGYHFWRLVNRPLLPPDLLTDFWKVFGNLRPRGAAGRESGRIAGRHFAATRASNRTVAPSSRRAKRTVANRRSAPR